MVELSIRTSRREEFIDLTRRIQEVVAQSGVQNGICVVFVPHTTCGVMINEHADPDVAVDIREALAKLVPDRAGDRHAEGNSPAHIKSSLVGCSEMLIIENGRIMLGTWQGVFLAEFDGPRSRHVWVKILRD